MSRITLMYLKNPWILTNWCNFLFLVIYSITMTFLYHLFALVITTSGWKGVRCLTLKLYSKQKWWFSQPVCKAFCAYSSTDAKKKRKRIVNISILLGVQQNLWREMLYKITKEKWENCSGNGSWRIEVWFQEVHFLWNYSKFLKVCLMVGTLKVEAHMN